MSNEVFAESTSASRQRRRVLVGVERLPRGTLRPQARVQAVLQLRERAGGLRNEGRDPTGPFGNFSGSVAQPEKARVRTSRTARHGRADHAA